MLEVNGISRYYGDTMAIEDISFRAERGQVVGLVGHNGSGKTTTMSIITSCLTPTRGEVFVNGKSVQREPRAAKAGIGYLPETPPVYPDMTVQEQLNFACGLRSVPRSDRDGAIARACAALDLTGVRGRLIRNLSKGYRQRVGFAQALIGDPPLLVLDEPMVGLDPRQIIELRELIGRLREKHTVLLSSHILSEIAATCDRIVVLSNGHLAADDTLEGLVRRGEGRPDLLLQADGPAEELRAAVCALPGVVRCECGTDAVSGRPEYRITVADQADIHEALFALLAGRGWPIRALQPVGHTLEEVFLQLTQDRRYQTEGGRENAGRV